MREARQPVSSRTGSYLSNSAYRKIKRVLSFRRRVFGQRLEETVLYERRYGVRVVPLVVEQCVAFIKERGLHEVGLFRQPGQATLVKELQEAFDAGEKPSFDSSTDVHTVASLLKLYLRQLPEPLVPYSRYQDFLLCGQKLSSERTQGLMELRSLLHDLPVANFNLLNYICQFLNEVQSYSSYNKMSCQNLATVFGPNILRAKAEDPHSIIGGAAVVQQLMLELIREHPSLFSCRPPPASCSAQPAEAGGGASCTSSSSSSALRRHPHLPRPSVCSRQLSLPLITERLGGGAGPGSVSTSPAQSSTDQHNPSCVPSGGAVDSVSQKRLRGHRYTSSHPENCFSPLPSTSYQPPQHHHTTTTKLDYQHHLASSGGKIPTAAPTTSGLRSEDPAFDGSKPRPALRGWAEARPNLGAAEEAACFWASGTKRGAAMVDGVTQGTASGGSSSDALDDSTLSVYDNLDRVSLSERMDEVGGLQQRFDGHYFEAASATGHNLGGHTATASVEEAGQTIDSIDSSWSSCEIIPLDERGDGGGDSPASSPIRRSPGFPSNRGSEDDKNDDDDDNDNDDDDDDDDEDNDHVDDDGDDEEDEDDDIFHPNTPESSSGPTDERLSTGSSEVFLPSGPSDLQESSDLQELRLQPQEPKDVHSLLAELRQQMAEQKVEYQARIHRLERCNDALQGQVRVLRASLEQQKRWHSVAEIKIRNVERARNDADRRNATLQREMEHFFRMFGEISGAEGRKGERFVQSF